MSNKCDLFNVVNECIVEVINNGTEVLLESKLMEDLGFDSLDIVELSMQLEERFGINIDSYEFEKIRTVQDILDFLGGYGIIRIED